MNTTEAGLWHSEISILARPPGASYDHPHQHQQQQPKPNAGICHRSSGRARKSLDLLNHPQGHNSVADNLASSTLLLGEEGVPDAFTKKYAARPCGSDVMADSSLWLTGRRQDQYRSQTARLGTTMQAPSVSNNSGYVGQQRGSFDHQCIKQWQMAMADARAIRSKWHCQETGGQRDGETTAQQLLCWSSRNRTAQWKSVTDADRHRSSSAITARYHQQQQPEPGT